MNTADSNAAAFTPVIPPAYNPVQGSPEVEPNAAASPTPYTLRTHYSNVENANEPAAVQPLPTKNTQNQKINAVHVSTSNVEPTTAQTPALIKPAPSQRPSRPITLKDLIPAAVRDRKFRAHSFGASLTREQRVLLFEWLGEDSLSEVQAKVAAPAPEGFGLHVHRTTLQRLRNSVENVELSEAVVDAMDSACDVLDPEVVADAAPLRETLSLLLYSRAIRTAQDADAVDLNRVITAIAKLEKLKPSAPSRPQSIARLKVDLTVANAQREAPTIQSISATPEPAIEFAPTLELQSAPTPDHKEANPHNPVHPVQNPSPNSSPSAPSAALCVNSPSHPDPASDPGLIASAAEIFQNCNLQTRPKSGQSGELEALLALAKARGINLARLDT
jgi:hypothetical protein